MKRSIYCMNTNWTWFSSCKTLGFHKFSSCFDFFLCLTIFFLCLNGISSWCLLTHCTSVVQFQLYKNLLLGTRSKPATSKNRKNLTLIVFNVKASNLPFAMKGNWDFRSLRKNAINPCFSLILQCPSSCCVC